MTLVMKSNGRMMSIPKGVITGLLWASMWMTVNVMLIGFLMIKETLDFGSIGYCSLFVLISSSYVCSYIAYRKIGRKRLIVSIYAAIAYFMLLILINVLCFGCKFEAVGVTLLCVLGGSELPLLMQTPKRGYVRRGTRKKVQR